ncbi:MAG: DUF5107 domain-containing protein [Candidatus Moduliflexus flocculans]|nr:DUF5107 domain-containing protein [Candidatus Moduliflexus flocculans]
MSAQSARTGIFRSTVPVAAVVLLALAVLGPACRPSSSGAAVVEEKSETHPDLPLLRPRSGPHLRPVFHVGPGRPALPLLLFRPVHGRARRAALDGRPAEQSLHRSRGPAPGRRQGLGAADKATGREFLYWNKVLKFRQIALRGPWTSGGIEFNFGVVGHAPSTATPVDYILRRNPDGSASCVVGTMDLPSRTRWSVTVTLPKDSAAFETNALWVNPTPFSQSYYAWSCAAVKTAEDLRYIFPGQWSIGHDYSVPLEPWPVDRSGRDLSLVPQQRHAGLQELLHGRRVRRFLRRLVREVRRRLRPLVPLRGHARPQGLDLGPLALRRDLGRPPHRRGRPVHRAPGRTAPQPVRPRRFRAGLGRPLAGTVVPLPGHRADDPGLAPRRPERGAHGRHARAGPLPAPARRGRPRRLRRRPGDLPGAAHPPARADLEEGRPAHGRRRRRSARSPARREARLEKRARSGRPRPAAPLQHVRREARPRPSTSRPAASSANGASRRPSTSTWPRSPRSPSTSGPSRGPPSSTPGGANRPAPSITRDGPWPYRCTIPRPTSSTGSRPGGWAVSSTPRRPSVGRPARRSSKPWPWSSRRRSPSSKTIPTGPPSMPSRPSSRTT